jgi:hypothetical protein
VDQLDVACISLGTIAKASPPARAVTAGRVAVCAPKGTAAQSIEQDVAPPPGWFAPHDSNDTLRSCLLIDERFSTPGQFSGLQIQHLTGDSVHVSLTLNPSPTQNAAFTASVAMWWAPPSDTALDPACHGAPSS